ncbi:twin-arginine translocation signal domain-containing protein [Halogeometricum sp. CBA1124]|nr:twin-arginine translocation signal domain-containing protein [Halogeometricum sp. CBA1124]
MSSTDDTDRDADDPGASLSRRDFVKVAAGIGAVAAGSTRR